MSQKLNKLYEIMGYDEIFGKSMMKNVQSTKLTGAYCNLRLRFGHF